jgi:uncharacterized membrane protein
MTFRLASEEAPDVTQTYRFTVETSIIGGLIGIVLIVLAIGGLLLVFQRYGRR